MTLTKFKLLAFAVAGIALATSSSPIALADPQRIQPADQLLAVAGEKVLGSEFTANNRPGFLLARGSLAIIVGSASLIESEGTKLDMQKEVLSPMRTAESAWPDRESQAGQKIGPTLWSCRDAVIVVRMQVEYLLSSSADAALALGQAASMKQTECRAALAFYSTGR
ncbi:hypothetical protein [Achromobacter insolitus]|uniref:hypothetical protein n=1 Tax=Achromobacter insolitus TaxID=217204 RepID=UPI0028AD2CC9|nr:hypothetical protein [Achromobacter insolitus]